MKELQLLEDIRDLSAKIAAELRQKPTMQRVKVTVEGGDDEIEEMKTKDGRTIAVKLLAKRQEIDELGHHVRRGIPAGLLIRFAENIPQTPEGTNIADGTLMVYWNENAYFTLDSQNRILIFAQGHECGYFEWTGTTGKYTEGPWPS